MRKLNYLPMKIKKYHIIPVLALLFAGISSFIACKKDGPTVATITVWDTLKRPVKGANVTLWQDTATNPTTGLKSTIRMTKITDAGGKASFDFSLEAYVNIAAAYNGDTATGEIHVKEHETASATVQFQ